MTSVSLDRLLADCPAVMTPEEVADILRMDKKALYRWLSDGTLPGFKLVGQWRILRDDLAQWLKSGANTPPAPQTPPVPTPPPGAAPTSPPNA